ncbi:transcription termination/antitermination factor NusG [Candidatus Marinimicrobia bacterium MT.SAG.3]|nr:transcription termination/antitermination factor NusG [Candidatus Marinimicrobia bacterium MT.SAG.3]
MAEDVEAVDSVAQPSKEIVEAEEIESESGDGSAAEEVDETTDAETTDTAAEETGDEKPEIEVTEPEPAIEDVKIAEETDLSEASEEAAETKLEEEESDEALDPDDPDGEHKIDIGKAKWYAIRTFSGQEKKIKDSLLANIHREKMDDSIFEILVPTENVVEMRDGKKRSRVKVFFPGYVLIQMDLNKETRFLIEETYGVLNFIGPGNNPQELKKKELRRILGDTEDRKKRNIMAAPYEIGDSIKVVDGPFNDFSGYVQEINEEKQKVKVMVSIFGRATPVELDFLQVALEK